MMNNRGHVETMNNKRITKEAMKGLEIIIKRN
jgi:hypothetical protein